jgi:hypothetical protein
VCTADANLDRRTCAGKPALEGGEKAKDSVGAGGLGSPTSTKPQALDILCRSTLEESASTGPEGKKVSIQCSASPVGCPHPRCYVGETTPQAGTHCGRYSMSHGLREGPTHQGPHNKCGITGRTRQALNAVVPWIHQAEGMAGSITSTTRGYTKQRGWLPQ